MDMSEVLRVLRFTGLIIYYWLEAILLFFVPARFRSKDVAGEKVLVTGGGGGLGRLLALDFARRGAQVIIWDINEKGMQETVKTVLAETGAHVKRYRCDLSKRDDIYLVADRVKKEVGDIDILVNNAGIVTGKKILESRDHLIDATMNINTNAHFWTLKSFLPSMLERDHGHVVTIASMAGIVGTNGLCDYCASKFAAVGLDEALRSEIHAQGKSGVHTTLVCPCYIDTGMFEGAHVKWQWLAPTISPEYAAGRIMDAILSNQHTLMMTRTMYLISFCKALMPVKCFMAVGDVSGITSSMNSFKGRSKED